MSYATTQPVDLLELTRELCSFRTGVVADENEAFFTRIAAELPVELHRYPSGSSFNGWLVPDLWRVGRATISKDGETVFDCGAHPLGVAAYSKSFRGELELDELRAHLVSSPELPQAFVYHCMWQYRPWDADWALSVPHEVLAALAPGSYLVELETSYEPGEMLVAEYELRGHSERTIVFNAHTCHPHMANDDMAGVAVLVRLFEWLRGQDTFYSYRLVLGPEHLGTVFYLRDRSREDLDRLVCGAFAEMPGTKGPLIVASSFLGGQPIDMAFANAAKHSGGAYRLVPWRRGAGNDETVWEAPGYEVPFVEVSRSEDLFAPYREYHTSLDTPDLLDEEQLRAFYDAFRGAIEALEQDSFAQRLFDGLVCLSSPDYDLYPERPDPAVTKSLAGDSEKWGYLTDCLPRYLDGTRTILEIAEKHELPFAALHRYLLRFQEKELIRLERAPVERLPVTRVRELAPEW